MSSIQMQALLAYLAYSSQGEWHQGLALSIAADRFSYLTKLIGMTDEERRKFKSEQGDASKLHMLP